MGGTPVKANYHTEGFVTAGKLVRWDGPDMPCLNLCSGDSVQDVVYKAGKALCSVLSELDMSELDLGCILEACASCPDPVKTLKHILQLIISKVCSLSEAITQAQSNGLIATSGNGTSGELQLKLPDMLQYVDPATETVVKYLPLSQFSQVVAGRVAGFVSAISGQTAVVSELQNRVLYLEENPVTDVPLPNVYPAYTGNQEPGDAVPITEAFTALEREFGELRNTTGNTTELHQAITKQYDGLANAPRLNGTGSMSTINGWVTSPQKASETLNNLWLTVNDMRSAIADIYNYQLKPDCNKIVLGYTLDFSEDRQSAVLKTTQSFIPYGWKSKMDLPAKLTIRELNGSGVYEYSITDLVNFTNNNSSSTLYLKANGIDITKSLTGELTGSFISTDGSLSCDKSIIRTFESQCITQPAGNLIISDVTDNSFVAQWSAPEDLPSPVTNYQVIVMISDTAGGWTTIRDDRTTSTMISFSSLLPDKDYRISVGVQYSCGQSEVIIANTRTLTAPAQG